MRPRASIDNTPRASGPALTLMHGGVFEEYAAPTPGGWTTTPAALEQPVTA